MTKQEWNEKFLELQEEMLKAKGHAAYMIAVENLKSHMFEPIEEEG